MADPTPELEPSALPHAQVAGRQRSFFSLVWIVPLVAALIGGWLAWKTINEKGPEFVIRFKTAEGLEAGKTKIKYKAVDVGTVESIELTPDRSTVLVHARLEKFAEDYLVKDSRFWVVRARITGATVQGLGTLLSGAYIGMDVGKSKETLRDFTGLEDQPIVTGDLPGRHFVLKSPTLGSYNLGSPVYFRKFAVGEVESYALDKDGRGVTVDVFIRAPHDQYVTNATRFWEASGIDVKLSASGVDLETESLASIVIGGIAFQSLDEGVAAEPADDNAAFRLYKNRATALAHRDVVIVPMAFRFNQSLRGLSVGAPVDFRGVVVGEVTDIRPQYENQHVYMVALANTYPERMAGRNIGTTRQELGLNRQQSMDLLVKGGMRAQVRTGNLLTGQLYIAIDIFKDAKPAQIAWNEKPPRFPTVEGAFSGIEENISQITKKIAAMPLDDIGKDTKKALETLDTTLKTIDAAVKQINAKVTPELSDALVDLRRSLADVNSLLAQDSPLQEDLRNALRDVSRAAASARVLLDYVEQHPESLIRGKSEEKP
ncbi:MAG: MlaD family protein [Betaproteobacteria bacterium]|jgi:paraquat-inducible protein B|nr:MlaD family protein [Betaproteobacteria bacterium]